MWDTVAAYGAPLDEMTRGISRYIWPLELPTHTLPRDRVTRACQALALDEERTTFHPELWNEGDVPLVPVDPDKERYIKDEQLSQVWFAGVHSNVGGGYPDDSLAYIPFVWMITEAQRSGLKFKSDVAKPPAPVADPDTFKNAISMRDKDGRIYDPRAGLGAYYRYGPRKLELLCNANYGKTKDEDDTVIIWRPKIHESAFRRIDNRAHAYAPVGLPRVYDVVREGDGAILTPSQFGLEQDDEAKARGDAQEHVWNEIWKRRIVYFATVGATLWLLVFPLVSAAKREDEFTSHFRWVSDLIRIVGAFLPGFAKPWIDGYARAPVSFVLLAALAGGLMWWGMRIASRISVSMGTIWRGVDNAPSGLPNNFIYRLRSSGAYVAFHEKLKYRWAPAFFALLFVYLGLCLASHLLYNVQDVAGFTCTESATTKTVADKEDKSSGAHPVRYLRLLQADRNSWSRRARDTWSRSSRDKTGPTAGFPYRWAAFPPPIRRPGITASCWRWSCRCGAKRPRTGFTSCCATEASAARRTSSSPIRTTIIWKPRSSRNAVARCSSSSTMP